MPPKPAEKKPEPCKASSSVFPKAGVKRQIIVNSETMQEIPDPKRPKYELNPDIKVKCLKTLIKAYALMEKAIYGKPSDAYEEKLNLNLSHGITSILFTCHNVCRQKANQTTSGNMAKKAAKTSHSVSCRGQTGQVTHANALKAWMDAVKENGLEYKNFHKDDKENWYGTMGPYLNFFGTWGLRLNELRIGHSMMPVAKDADGTIKQVEVKRYGLNGSHHILLERCTFPPERRSSMAQSLGPMTAMLCMLRNTGKYRPKWEDAVKRAFSHIPCIDDIIETTRNANKASDVHNMIRFLADISLIATTRQAQRMTMPLVVFKTVYDNLPDDASKKIMLENFNVSGKGAFRTYQLAHDIQWELNGNLDDYQAAQATFHAIFGTYKEDLGVLEVITNHARWYTREEFGGKFRKMGTSTSFTTFRLPKLIYYSKLSSANQSGKLSGVYQQTTSASVFSAYRQVYYTQDFFDNLQKKEGTSSDAKSIPAIITCLSATLKDLQKELAADEMAQHGTVAWHSAESLSYSTEGPETDLNVNVKNKFFMGSRNANF